MGKLVVPKVIRELDLGEYAPEYAGQAVIEVWVNPTRGDLAEFEEIRAELIGAFEAVTEKVPEGDETQPAVFLQAAGERVEKANRRLCEWWAVVWSQGKDPERHWTAAEVQDLHELCMEQDPMLWEFVMRRSFEKILEFRGDRRKK